MDADVRYFATRSKLRTWFERHHGSAREVWVGFPKAHVRAKSVQYLEALEEALCFGWIDTTVRRVDDERYAHRFTPRREGSRWSDANRLRFEDLRKAGLVSPAGQRAFDRGAPDDPRRYSYERGGTPFSSPYTTRFLAHPVAWRFFHAEPPSYQRLAAHWVMSAVREATRDRRFDELLETSMRETRPRAFLVARADRRRSGFRARTPARRGRKRAALRRPVPPTESR